MDGVEVVLSCLRKTDFGPVLSIGSGGVAIELYRDIVHLALPARLRRRYCLSPAAAETVDPSAGIPRPTPRRYRSPGPRRSPLRRRVPGDAGRNGIRDQPVARPAGRRGRGRRRRARRNGRHRIRRARHHTRHLTRRSASAGRPRPCGHMARRLLPFFDSRGKPRPAKHVAAKSGGWGPIEHDQDDQGGRMLADETIVYGEDGPVGTPLP